MAARHQHLAQHHPHAPSHNRAPRAAHPDLELFPFLTDTFIDSLTAAQAQRWAALVMPNAVSSTIRKNCNVKEKRSTLKFLRDLKRGGTLRCPDRFSILVSIWKCFFFDTGLGESMR